jgi:hypothetical protein
VVALSRSLLSIQMDLATLVDSRFLADNDIIHKLACCGLLQQWLQWLVVPPAEVWVLPSMRFVVRSKFKDDQAAMTELDRFLTQVAHIPSADIESLERISSEMDVGERQMLAVLLCTPEAKHLVTGDKRALRLMGRLCEEDATLDQRLGQVQVDCLESIMLGLINTFGFELINAKATLGVKSDKVLQVSFGPKKSAENSRQSLNYYLDDVRKSAPFLAKP